MKLSRKDRKKQGKKHKYKEIKVEEAVIVEEKRQKKGFSITSIYEKQYKKLLIIPIILLLLAIK